VFWAERQTGELVEQGKPVALDGVAMGMVELVETIDGIGNTHGFGRVDMIENRLVGIKSREVYEVAGSLALITAHRELEDLVLTRDLLHFKRSIESKLADMIYEGQWFDPLTEACKAFLFSTQERVSGTIRLRFFKGTCAADGRRSANTLYNYKLATYSKEDEFSHAAAAGFTEPMRPIERFAFYERAKGAFCVVMTGELAKYGNIILKKGVTPV